MHGQYKDAQCIDALSEVACNMLRNHVPQGSCRTPSSPHSKQPTASVYSGDPDEIEKAVTDYLRTIQECREEIRIEVCQPTPDLPGYPEVDYHPKDAPIVLIDDLPEDERPEEPVIIPLYD